MSRPMKLRIRFLRSVAWWECRRRCAARVTGLVAGRRRGRAPNGAGEEDRDGLVGPDGARPHEVEEAGEAGTPGVIDVDAGRRAGQGVRLHERRLGGDQRAAAARQHAGHAGAPVVRLVVDDPVGDAARLLLPGPHEGRPVAGGIRERSIGGSPAATRARTRSKARASGWTVAGWTAWIRGSAAPPYRKPAMTDDSSAPPPTWTTTRSRRGGPPGSPDRGRQLPAERLAALDREAVQVPLAGERDGAGRDRPQEGVVGRVAGSPRLALADGAGGAEGPPAARPRRDRRPGG